ncbi:MAG: peptidyl-prolyl cis-trans isomerase [Acidobacteriota bacterium]
MIRILQQDNAFTKTVFAVIIGATIILMVIFLVPGIFDNGAQNDASLFATVKEPGVLGKLWGETSPIKLQEVQRMAEQQMQQQGFPQQYLPLLINRAGQLQVERMVLQHEADKLGLQVSDADLATYLKTGPYAEVLFPGGKFIGQDHYIDFVQQYGLAVTDFENELKSELELQRLQTLVTGGVTVSDAAVRADYMQSGTKVKFDYAVVSSGDVMKNINATDADLQDYFKKNAARYATAVPETRQIAFFSFDNSQIPGGAPQVSDADVQAYYNAHQAQYQTPAQVQTRHILITVPSGGDKKADADAKAKAADVLKQLKAGAKFADLAKKYSDDPGSKDKGGELPMIPVSGLDPAYGNAAMALNPGQTSDLVRSQFGYHIIQTEAKQDAHVKSLAEVKDGIVAQLQGQKAAGQAQDYASKLASEAAKNGMQKTADAHGLHLQTTDYVGQTGVIGSLPDSAALIKAAFSTAKGVAPATAPTGEGYAVFQVADVKAAHAPDFEAFKPQLLTDYREQRVPELLNAELIKLSDRAKILGDLKKAAAEMNVPVKSSDLVGREAQVPDIGSLTGPASVVFSLPKGGISGPINEGPNGSVLQLTDKQEPTPEDVAKNLEISREKLLNQKRQEVFGVFAGALMQRYEKAGAIIYSKKQGASPLGL